MEETQTPRPEASHASKRAPWPTPETPSGGRPKYRAAVSIEDTSPEQVFEFVRSLNNLPLFIKGIRRVEPFSETRSHWTVRLKTGFEVEWDVELIKERPG